MNCAALHAYKLDRSFAHSKTRPTSVSSTSTPSTMFASRRTRSWHQAVDEKDDLAPAWGRIGIRSQRSYRRSSSTRCRRGSSGTRPATAIPTGCSSCPTSSAAALRRLLLRLQPLLQVQAFNVDWHRPQVGVSLHSQATVRHALRKVGHVALRQPGDHSARSRGERVQESVFAMIREIMLDPAELRARLVSPTRARQALPITRPGRRISTTWAFPRSTSRPTRCASPPKARFGGASRRTASFPRP
jgi:hypothetical protein